MIHTYDIRQLSAACLLKQWHLLWWRIAISYVLLHSVEGVLQVKVIYTFGESLAYVWVRWSCGEEGLWDVKIYHFYELFTGLMPYPETTTQVFNLFLVKPCLENLHSSLGSTWTFVYFKLWLIDQTISTIFQLQQYNYMTEMYFLLHRNSIW